MTERAAQYLADAFFKSGVAPTYFVAVPGWTQDTLTTACANDPNVVGGLIIKYVSFYTDAFWILYNAETQHVTPSLIYVSCWRQKAVQVAPTLSIHTQKSGPQISVPMAPLTAMAVLFTFRGSTSTTTAYQVGYGSLALITAAGGLSGNVGVYNPGHEALGVANRVALQSVVVTNKLCGIPIGDRALPGGSTLVQATSEMLGVLEPANGDAQITPSLEMIAGLKPNDRAQFANLIGVEGGLSSAMSSTNVPNKTTGNSTTLSTYPSVPQTSPPDSTIDPPLTTLCIALGATS
ncbi:MAG: hypothetical protein ABSE64_07925 [Vulcanimicrobiaceae bacterium]